MIDIYARKNRLGSAAPAFRQSFTRLCPLQSPNKPSRIILVPQRLIHIWGDLHEFVLDRLDSATGR